MAKKGGGEFGDIKAGALHRELHVPLGQPISMDQLREAMRGAVKRHDAHEEHQIEFAENARHFHHPGHSGDGQ